jgi:pyroglutamyl-peptidase
MPTLVTGFLAFGRFAENPSARLAESLGRPFELIEVAFAAADECIDRLAADAAHFDRLLMLGVRGDGSAIHLERVARNLIGPSPDVRGEARPGPIDPAGAAQMRTTLFDSPVPDTQFSDDAGSYLCNYAYYRALCRLPGKQVGFVHVPPVEAVPLEEQRRRLLRLLEILEASHG